jgi:hypothetical protein
MLLSILDIILKFSCKKKSNIHELETTDPERPDPDLYALGVRTRSGSAEAMQIRPNPDQQH